MSAWARSRHQSKLPQKDGGQNLASGLRTELFGDFVPVNLTLRCDKTEEGVMREAEGSVATAERLKGMVASLEALNTAQPNPNPNPEL